MKDRVLNILLLFTVAAALILSLKRSGPRAQKEEALFSFPSPAALHFTPSPAEDFRARRAQARSLETEALQALISGKEPGDAAWAEETLRSLVADTETELTAEAALAARGDGESLCAAQQGELIVFLAHPLTEAEAGTLTEVIVSACGVPSEKIRFVSP